MTIFVKNMRPLLFLLLAIPFTVLSQNNLGEANILLLNGEEFKAPVIDTSFFGIKILAQKRKKQKEVIIEGDRLFSIKFRNTPEKLYYKQDSLFANYYTVEETRFFIRGEQDARKYKCHFATASSFVIGASSIVVLPSIFSLAPPFAYSASTLVSKVRIRHSTVSNLNYLNYDTYILGYERVARKKRLIQSLKGSLAGLAVGFAGVYVYSNFIKE